MPQCLQHLPTTTSQIDHIFAEDIPDKKKAPCECSPSPVKILRIPVFRCTTICRCVVIGDLLCAWHWVNTEKVALQALYYFIIIFNQFYPHYGFANMAPFGL